MRKNITKRADHKAPITTLTESEIERVAEKLAVALEHDEEDMGLLLMLVNHFEQTREDFLVFSMAAFSIKQKLFAGTIAASDAQEQFERQAIKTRGKLLAWPSEQVA